MPYYMGGGGVSCGFYIMAPEILLEIEYLVIHNFFWGGKNLNFWNVLKFFEFLWNFWNFMKIWEKKFFPNSRFLVRSVFVINVSIFTSVVCYYQNGMLYPELSFLLRYRLYLCQRPFYKILVKVRNSKHNVLKIVLIIVNINKDENKSLISTFQINSLFKMIFPPFLGELFCGGKN